MKEELGSIHMVMWRAGFLFDADVEDLLAHAKGILMMKVNPFPYAEGQRQGESILNLVEQCFTRVKFATDHKSS